MPHTLRPAVLADVPALSAFASAHFPDAAPSHDGILAIVLLLCAGVIWRGTPRTEERGSGR